ncbi:MAG TPA: hypothetical protein DD435_00240 [Cyanobacteria bacterium UBA8530]|nr:hypothetical protein [Cyanobacteria bacterium UBA8530]
MQKKLMIALVMAGVAGCTQAPPGTEILKDNTPFGATVGERQIPPAGDPFVSSDGQPLSSGTDYLPDELLVGVSDDSALPLELGALGKATLMSNLHFTHPVLQLRLPEGVSLKSAMEIIRSKPGVLSVSLNYRMHPLAVPSPWPDDPLLPSQWPFVSSVADVYGAWALPAFTDIESKIKDTTVAVIDTGVDPDQPDLRVLPGYSACETAVFPSTGAVPTSSFDKEEDDHGTCCSGVIGALKNNSIGAAGVAPGVSILPIKVLGGKYGSTTMAVLNGIYVAGYYNRPDSPYTNLQNPAAGPVRVVNLSLGNDSVARLEIYESAFEFLRERGIVACVSAGNDNNDGRVQCPALSPAALAISCTMQFLGTEMLAPYSSRGAEIWVAGPGNFIWATQKGYDDEGVFIGYDHAYGMFNGTSSAAPFVAGVAALINAVLGPGGEAQNTAAWADKVKQRLKDSADDLGAPGFDHLYGHGRVNARRAIATPL